MAQAVVSGSVDIALNPGSSVPDLVSPAGGGRLVAHDIGSVDASLFVTIMPGPLQERRVRLALNYAVNKQPLIDAFVGDATKPATRFAPPGKFGFKPDETQPFPYDPAKARALRADAGYPNSFDLPVELMISVMSASFEQAAADLREVGVRVTLTNIAVSTYSEHYYQNIWKGLAFYSGYNSAPSFDALAPLRLHSCLWPKPWICDPEISNMVVSVDRIFNPERRAEQTRALMARLNTEVPALLLYEGFKITALGLRVKTFESPSGFIRFDALEMRD